MARCRAMARAARFGNAIAHFIDSAATPNRAGAAIMPSSSRS